MAKLPPISFSPRSQISTYIPPSDTSPDHTSFDQATRSLHSTLNIAMQSHRPKPKPTCHLATTREDAAPPVSKETTTPYCGGETVVQFVAVSRGNNNCQRFRVTPQGMISSFKPRIDSRRNGKAIIGEPSGSDIDEYETKMPQKQAYGKQVGTSTRNQRQNFTSRTTRNLVAPPKHAWMQSGYVPTILEPRERATLSAGNKRLLRRRQDANGPRFPPSSIGVATDEIHAFPQQATTRANTYRQQHHLRTYSNNPCPETSRAAFEAEEGGYPTLPLSPTKIGRQRRPCGDNRRNRRIAVCLATDTTTRDREHARVMIKRF